MRSLIMTLLLLVSSICFAQYSDKQLFDAYLRQDMKTWKAFIDSNDWQKLSRQDRIRLISYEYGFVAYRLDEDKKLKKDEPHLGPKYLEAFRAHVAEMKPYLSESTYSCYMSSINAYDFLIDASKLKSGMQAYKLAGHAAEVGKDDPLALTLYGSVLFFAPRIFGGSKTEGRRLFEEAEKLFRAQTPEAQEMNNWNFASCLMHLAMSIEKTESVEAAIRKCEAILREYPDFAFIKNEYLPELRKKAKSN